MYSRNRPPSITATAFDCPHCGAFTTQHWFELYADPYDDDARTPSIPSEEERQLILSSPELAENVKGNLVQHIDRVRSGRVFLDRRERGAYISQDVENLFLSRCYNCAEIAVWVHDSLVFPPERVGSQPNPDLPEDILCDFEEARSILNLSPRGAAALLRLCVQKLCAFLGEKGKNIDDDIASLVSKGLNPLVQKSLDVVRVIGNEAVHPGVIDLKDDRRAAIKLLDLVNVIADQMITHPRAIEQIYEGLPEAKRKAIEARNERALKKN